MSILRVLTVGAFGITIFLAVLVEGMVVSRADVAYLFSKPGRLVRTILAMNVLGPIVGDHRGPVLRASSRRHRRACSTERVFISTP